MTDLEKAYIDLFNKVAGTEKVAAVTKEAVSPWVKRLALGALGAGGLGGAAYLGSQFGGEGGDGNEERAQQLGYQAATEPEYGYAPYAYEQQQQYDPYANEAVEDPYDYYDDLYGGYY